MAEIIDYDKAMEQVGGDVDFLKEVLGDLLQEADEAESQLNTYVKEENADEVRKAAHRIKGSASYLFCERLRKVAFALQDKADEIVALNKKDDSADEKLSLWNAIRGLFPDYCSELEALKSKLIELDLHP
eukprot:gene6092-6709_t